MYYGGIISWRVNDLEQMATDRSAIFYEKYFDFLILIHYLVPGTDTDLINTLRNSQLINYKPTCIPQSYSKILQ